MTRFVTAIGIGLILAPTAVIAGGEIYGTIYTTQNEEFTGAIRWDRNENYWDDVLDADKRDKVYHEGRRRRTFKFFGIVFGGDNHGWTTSQFKIQFGHIEAIEPRRGNNVRIELKSGERISVRSDGTDLGDGMRGIWVFDDAYDEEIELDWDDVDRVEFRQGPKPGLDDKRLYGTVETSGGDFTGFIVWDKDEAVVSDILNGEDRGRTRKIKFGKIRSIERRGSSASMVTLKDGRTMKLSGTNDVDDDNRGIDITVIGLGLIKVDWRDFDRVTFSDPPASREYADFDGGRRLYGTLEDDSGEKYTGKITWDMDEAFTWEFLDGDFDDISYVIPFSNIKRIERNSRRSATVTLLNGQEIVLSGSNDVDRDNKGILVELESGGEMEFDWNDFDSVEFHKP